MRLLLKALRSPESLVGDIRPQTAAQMKSRNLTIVIALLGLAGIMVLLYTLPAKSVAARPMRLVITGPTGQPFHGCYVADSVTNVIRAIAPATIDVPARNVTYEFKREGGEGEFRVMLYVSGVCRTSATSDRLQGVRGAVRYGYGEESYWAAAF